MALALFRKAKIVPPPDIEAASLRSDRFRLEREGEWQRLDSIVTCLEKNRPGRISDDDLLALLRHRRRSTAPGVAGHRGR